MKLISTFLFLMSASLSVLAETYSLQGSLGEDAATKKKISFTLSWDENDGKASGTYKDNFYANSAPVKGVTGELGRIFVVTFPKEVNGVRTISFLTSDIRGAKGSALIPVSVSLRDGNGTPVKTSSIEANLSGAQNTMVAQAQEEEPCQEGFGDLAGYCNSYAGMISEDTDTKSRCNLLAFNSARLRLENTGEVYLALGESSNIVEVPVHRIGRIFSNPTSMSIDLLSRTCRSLPGTTFPSDDCKRLSLTGVFSSVRKTRHFTGSYTISNEKNNESCRYSLSMDEEI